MLHFFQSIIALIATFGCMVAGVFTGTNFADFNSKYKKDVNAFEAYENTIDTAIPQTEIYDMIKNHMTSELPEGKTVKKAIVIGYDGCRADNLVMCKSAEESGINTLLSNGGHAALAYCGGVPYPAINTQDTSTAPGWCTMLTGQWADVHGVTENSIPKSNDNLTLLTTLVEDDTIDSSAFYVSWGGHFSDDDSTYINELNYIKENDINSTFLKADDDNGTRDNVMADISKADCSDFIFSIFEYCDHTGHDTGFSHANPEIVEAFKDAELTSREIITAIESRETYETEDWLIIITTDHGGYNNWHGGPTIQERMIFIVSNKEILTK